jgi:hypothetical protein
MKSYFVSQLYESTPKIDMGMSSERNPLAETGALNEAEFIDMRLTPQRSRVGIIFDTRLCGDFEGSNTALVVLIGTGKVSWTNNNRSRQYPWYAQYGSLSPRISGRSEAPSPASITDKNDIWALDALNTADRVDAPVSTSQGLENRPVPEYTLVFGSLSVSALHAQIYVGHIDGLDGAIPDMSELPDAEIIAGYPQWSSVMEVREHYIYPD